MGKDEIRYSLRVKTLDVINSEFRVGLLLTVDPAGIGESSAYVEQKPFCPHASIFDLVPYRHLYYPHHRLRSKLRLD